MVVDGGNDLSPIFGMNFMAAALYLYELCIDHSSRQCLAVRQREDRIGRAMKDKKRRHHLVQPALPYVADLKEDAVVGGAEITSGAVEISFKEGSGPGFVERMYRPGGQARILDQICDGV